LLFSFLLLHFWLLTYAISAESSANMAPFVMLGPSIWSLEEAVAGVSFLRLLAGTLARAGSTGFLLASLSPIHRKQIYIFFGLPHKYILCFSMFLFIFL
jgi:hypothetical protein